VERGTEKANPRQ